MLVCLPYALKRHTRNLWYCIKVGGARFEREKKFGVCVLASTKQSFFIRSVVRLASHTNTQNAICNLQKHVVRKQQPFCIWMREREKPCYLNRAREGEKERKREERPRNLSNIPFIVCETKMKPVIQFDKQFIIVIFLTLLCTQRIFGYDLSLLTVRVILRWIRNLIVPLFSVVIWKKNMLMCAFHFRTFWAEFSLPSRERACLVPVIKRKFNIFFFIRLKSFLLWLFSLLLVYFSRHNISPYFLLAHDDCAEVAALR